MSDCTAFSFHCAMRFSRPMIGSGDMHMINLRKGHYDLPGWVCSKELNKPAPFHFIFVTSLQPNSHFMNEKDVLLDWSKQLLPPDVLDYISAYGIYSSIQSSKHWGVQPVFRTGIFFS